MKLFSKLFIIISIFFLTLCVLPQVASAVGSPADNPDDPGIDPDTPVDGGVGILIAAGVLYGVKKIRDARHRKLTKIS